jgi:hypothetical protein
MDGRTLKIIGIITMTLDHVAVHLVEPSSVLYLVLRGFGRFAFPIFALMVAQGFRHSKNLKGYVSRLFAYALLIEAFLLILLVTTGLAYSVWPFFGTSSENVIWPLAFGLLALVFLSRESWISLAGIIAIIVLVPVLNYPYGIYGVAMIVLFGMTKDRRLWFLGTLALTSVYVFVPLLTDPETFSPVSYLQMIAPLAVLMFFLYNGKRGRGNKWFFYVYYPLHIGVLVGLSMII